MRLLLTTIILMATAVSATAHEYWFEADSFFLNKGQSMQLHLFVGEALKKDEERVYQAAKTTSFQMISPSGTFDMRTMADDDKSPILKFSTEGTGTYLFSMVRNWSYITLDADKFEAYLRDEGMDYIVAERKRIGESKKPGRERYSRFIKTAVQVGGNKTASAMARVDSKLEIVPLNNPYSRKVGETLNVQIRFDRRPLANAAIFADNRNGDRITTQKVTTDADGKASIKLSSSGLWLIRLVYMQRCTIRCEGADWESFWGAFSFGLR